jgi:hypothetical protein
MWSQAKQIMALWWLIKGGGAEGAWERSRHTHTESIQPIRFWKRDISLFFAKIFLSLLHSFSLTVSHLFHVLMLSRTHSRSRLNSFQHKIKKTNTHQNRLLTLEDSSKFLFCSSLLFFLDFFVTNFFVFLWFCCECGFVIFFMLYQSVCVPSDFSPFNL